MFNNSKMRFATIVLIVLASLGVLLGVSFLVADLVSQKSLSKVELNPVKNPYQQHLASNNEILVLSSYSYAYPATRLEIKGIVDTLDQKGFTYEICYLDSKTYPTKENEKLFYEQLKYKMTNHSKFSAVLLLDDPVFAFAQNYYDEFFSDIPVFFMGVSDLIKASIFSEKENVTGVIQFDTVDDTIRIGVGFNPHASKIYALTDGTETGLAYQYIVESQKKFFPDKEIIVINASDYARDELADKLQLIGTDSVFLFLSLVRDGEKHIYSAAEANQFVLSNVTKIPVYSLAYGEIANGILGGKIYDFYEAAKTIALQAVEHVNGQLDISNMGFLDNIDGKFYFDYKVFKKFGLNKELLPENSIFLNRHLSYFESYSAVLIPFCIISISLLVLLVILCFNYIKATRAQVQVMLRNKAIDRKNKMLRESEEKLRSISEKDFLTDIPNRLLASEVLKQFISMGEDFFVLQMDIDGFKNYNDYYTHDCGDFVLKEFSSRLKEISKKLGCFVARYGGDEFLLFYKGNDFTEESQAYRLVKETLNKPCVFRTIKLELSSSCGVASFVKGLDANQLLSNADIAMYRAKQNGKGNIVFFDPSMRDEINKRHEIASILDDECKNNGFSIKYQPQIDAVTGNVYGFEALVRLEKQQISPGVFIPIAEEGGYITKIGRIVAEKVVEQMAQWRKNGIPLKKVAINYSSGQLVDSDYVDFLSKLLARYNIPPSLVDIEITESLFMENNTLARKLFDSLSKIGVGLVLDDFGTGYSSLSYLTYLPVGKVKIDKTLVDNYLVDGKDSFIRNIVRLVHDLGMELTVEGVERKEQYERLKELNCDYIQGYYFSKPISGKDVESFKVAN